MPWLLPMRTTRAIVTLMLEGRNVVYKVLESRVSAWLNADSFKSAEPPDLPADAYRTGNPWRSQ